MSQADHGDQPAIAFTVDRTDLPKRWAKPLVFTLRAGNIAVDVEIEQNAAIEYQAVRRSNGMTDVFLDELEIAVNRLYAAGAVTGPTLTLAWDDLHPDTSDRFKP